MPTSYTTREKSNEKVMSMKEKLKTQNRHENEGEGKGENNCKQVTHLHSDHGSYFTKLGSIAMVVTGRHVQGEYLRLFLMLKSLKMSASGGHSTNIVKSHIKRLKLMWQSSSTFLAGLSGYTMIEIDYLLKLFCSELN